MFPTIRVGGERENLDGPCSQIAIVVPRARANSQATTDPLLATPKKARDSHGEQGGHGTSPRPRIEGDRASLTPHRSLLQVGGLEVSRPV